MWYSHHHWLLPCSLLSRKHKHPTHSTEKGGSFPHLLSLHSLSSIMNLYYKSWFHIHLRLLLRKDTWSDETFSIAFTIKSCELKILGKKWIFNPLNLLQTTYILEFCLTDKLPGDSPVWGSPERNSLRWAVFVRQKEVSFFMLTQGLDGNMERQWIFRFCHTHTPKKLISVSERYISLMLFLLRISRDDSLQKAFGNVPPSLAYPNITHAVNFGIFYFQMQFMRTICQFFISKFAWTLKYKKLWEYLNFAGNSSVHPWNLPLTHRNSRVVAIADQQMILMLFVSFKFNHLYQLLDYKDLRPPLLFPEEHN